jgi:hypothetical protein
MCWFTHTQLRGVCATTSARQNRGYKQSAHFLHRLVFRCSGALTRQEQTLFGASHEPPRSRIAFTG